MKKRYQMELDNIIYNRRRFMNNYNIDNNRDEEFYFKTINNFTKKAKKIQKKDKTIDKIECLSLLAAIFTIIIFITYQLITK